MAMGQSFGRMIGLDNHDLMRVAASAPMLDKEVELDLARRWRENGDTQALGRLTRSYLRLVISMAGRFRAYGLPMSDLVQEGMVGLMEAAARFEPDRELRFSTYATWWIRAAMQDFILRNWSIVRTGTTAAHKSLFFNLRRLRAQIAGDQDNFHDGAMSHSVRQSLANKLGVRVLDVETMEARLTGGDRSLNIAVGEEPDSEWIDFLACDAPRPDEALETSNDSRIRTNLVREALGALSHRANWRKTL
jgi:RNA polymerase sigma-32 factor